MKDLRLLFAVLLAPLVFHAAVADDAGDIARATTRQNSQTTVSAARKKTAYDTNNSAPTTASRAVSIPTTQKTVRERGTTASRSGNVIPRTPDITKAVTARTTSNLTTRNSPTKQTANVSRAASTPTRAQTISRTATTKRAPTAHSRSATVSRNATAIDASTVLSRDYGKCREVFNSCMDEFCANKDAELARCACSARATEFEQTKQSLANIEDKLLNFGERLLVVNMDAEDVNAMNNATDGELAYNQGDKSSSKKMLDEIAKKLNTSFDDSNFDNNLNAINLSLNMDAAFDNVDSMLGASTTTKSGPSLYNAALPVCREMAAEVCSPDELSIAESGYQMIIEQDCNTVAKTYQTQTDLARSKVFESGALLDMSRLDIYQQRNSDDILTCKSKMLDMLTDSTVCGADMGKCLDTSGKYIDPTTGTAFLTDDLYELESLITRPSNGASWSSVPNNNKFVTFLNSKKTFLEPAMEKCQDISSYVWDEFIDDALAQIKLAQTKKLEDVRQSCTTLTTQCLDDAFDSISEFDSRALSIFGVTTDKTVNAMCADVRNACSALMQHTFDDAISGSEWGNGMSDIALSKTYDTILSTCSEVGRQCIINTCKSISGNFGLCNDIKKSINRGSILHHSACWDDVYKCVLSAGLDTIDKIITRTDNKELYDTYTLEPKNTDYSNVDKLCENHENAKVCLISEEIWGNCEYKPTETVDNKNRIHITKDDERETLLSWFARNTGTENDSLSCYDHTICAADKKYIVTNGIGICVSTDAIDSVGNYCENTKNMITIYNTGDTEWKNCCSTGKTDKWGNCCENALKKVQIYNYYFGTNNFNTTDKVCAPSGDSAAYLIASYDSHNIICFSDVIDVIKWTPGDDANTDDAYPNGTTITCVGTLVDIQVSDNNHATYHIPTIEDGETDSISYYKLPSASCYSDSTVSDTCSITPENIENWLINYTPQPTTTTE
ncbi:MAG: hypothetical protein IKB10_02645 [Alphaproteobacteria bacterium]|nr:hypothetical protein [Alphaproteobacteria bacterium]